MNIDSSAISRGMSIAHAAGQLGCSVPTIKRKLAAGELSAVKLGRKTLVTVASINTFWESLPAATFRKPRKKAA